MVVVVGIQVNLAKNIVVSVVVITIIVDVNTRSGGDRKPWLEIHLGEGNSKNKPSRQGTLPGR